MRVNLNNNQTSFKANWELNVLPGRIKDYEKANKGFKELAARVAGEDDLVKATVCPIGYDQRRGVVYYGIGTDLFIGGTHILGNLTQSEAMVPKGSILTKPEILKFGESLPDPVTVLSGWLEKLIEKYPAKGK